MLNSSVIEKCQPTRGQFISSFFLTTKSDGCSKRFILNLKQLNKHITPPHFKLEDFRTVTKLMQKGDYMASVDLKDAYYALPIYVDHRKYLRFIFENQLFQFITFWPLNSTICFYKAHEASCCFYTKNRYILCGLS